MCSEECHHLLENVEMVVDFEEWFCEMGKKRDFLGQWLCEFLDLVVMGFLGLVVVVIL